MILLALVATFGSVVFTLFVLYANSMRSSPGPFVGKWLVIAAWCLMLLFWCALATDKAKAADLALPPEIVIGRPFESRAFGPHSSLYMKSRWARLCKGGGRYDAMREAYERGLTNPCQ